MAEIITIGKLKDRVQLQSAVEASDDFSESIITWMTYDTVWANIKPFTGKEYYHSQQQVGQVEVVITIRYRTGIIFGHRVVYVNTVKSITDNYEITGIVNRENKNEWLELLCKRVAA